MSDKQDGARTGWFKKGNRWMIAIAVGTVLVVGSALGVQALVDGRAYSHIRHLAGDGFHHGRNGAHHGRFAELSDAAIEARIERMVQHVAIEIDATREQQDKITALVTAVALDLKPVGDRMHDAGKEFHDLLLADTIDRAALDMLRAERLAEASRISENLVNAMVDVAEVLSPEQRKRLDERLNDFQFMRRGWYYR